MPAGSVGRSESSGSEVTVERRSVIGGVRVASSFECPLASGQQFVGQREFEPVRAGQCRASTGSSGSTRFSKTERLRVGARPAEVAS